VTAFNGLPHADLIEIPVFYSSKQAFNSSARVNVTAVCALPL